MTVQEKWSILATVANLYYNSEMTQNEIADRMYTSRSKISRMLKEARELGIVEISIKEPWERDLNLEKEIQELKEVCKERHLKVILETGALKTASNIKKASILSMYSGADFIKTSTGKQQPAATPEAAYVMCEAIKEYYQKTNNKIGFKPAGGINTVHDAIIYYTIVKEILGEEWLNNRLFRLGTSRLANLLLSDIKGEEIKFF